MGLDREVFTCLNEYMMQLPQYKMGFWGRFASLSSGLAALLGKEHVVRQSPLAMERKRFEKEVHEQFVKLKEKGLSIPVFTL
jgi:hypothetical protein